MGRANKKESIARLNRENILKSAEDLFTKNGFCATTIDDISRESEYSRRTIYSYFKSKEEIMQQIVLKGLVRLKSDISLALNENNDFLGRYFSICICMVEYQKNYPFSSESVNGLKTDKINPDILTPVTMEIFKTGTDINSLLEQFIEDGKKSGAVCTAVNSKKTVFVIWSCITSLIQLTENKGEFIAAEFGTTAEEFLKYGFTQIINSILEARI